MLRIRLLSGALSDKFRHVSNYQSISLNTGQSTDDTEEQPAISQAPTYLTRVGVHTGYTEPSADTEPSCRFGTAATRREE